MSILFLSGPSGAGKTTFLQLLRRGELAPHLQSMFEPGAADWPVLDMTNELRDAIKRDGAEAVWSRIGAPDRRVIHYDIVSVPRSGQATYADDPTFDFIGGLDDVQFVFLRPAPDQLLQQFSTRLEARQAEKFILSRVWTRLLRPKFEQKLYADADAIGEICDRWGDFAGQIAAKHGNRPVIELRPVSGGARKPDFEVVRVGLSASGCGHSKRSR
ncbi:MAG: hypothetical protein C0519_05555 [Hyphomicrobium sp.]|nr:hypothetical protein [Hyphomicrobium sp.]